MKKKENSYSESEGQTRAIKFIKILKYETTPKDIDIFEFLSALTMQQIDPSSISQFHIRTNAKIVFHSPLKRAIDILELKEGVEYIRMNELSEILFDIKKLCTKKEWQEEKSNIVRRRFKEFFINDQLPIKRVEIFNEIKRVLNNCLSRSEFFDITIISHSFRLKLIEIFIETKGEIVEIPVLIHKYLLDDKKTYEFGEGFILKREELEELKNILK